MSWTKRGWREVKKCIELRPSFLTLNNPIPQFSPRRQSIGEDLFASIEFRQIVCGSSHESVNKVESWDSQLETPTRDKLSRSWTRLINNWSYFWFFTLSRVLWVSESEIENSSPNNSKVRKFVCTSYVWRAAWGALNQSGIRKLSSGEFQTAHELLTNSKFFFWNLRRFSFQLHLDKIQR